MKEMYTMIKNQLWVDREGNKNMIIALDIKLLEIKIKDYKTKAKKENENLSEEIDEAKGKIKMLKAKLQNKRG
jgi:hypothetical protein